MRIIPLSFIVAVALISALRCGVSPDVDKELTRESVHARLGAPCKVDQGAYEIWSYATFQRVGMEAGTDELRWNHSTWCPSVSIYNTFYFWKDTGKLSYWEDADGVNHGTDYSELKVRDVVFPEHATQEQSGMLFSYYGQECRSVLLDAGLNQRDYCGKACTEAKSGWCLASCDDYGSCPRVEILVRNGVFADIRFPPPSQKSTSAP